MTILLLCIGALLFIIGFALVMFAGGKHRGYGMENNPGDGIG